MKKIFKIILPAIALILLSSCSSLKRYDDAIRIKEAKFAQYTVTPGSDSIRIGSTLEGTVTHVLIESKPVSCEEDLGFIYDTSVVFLNKNLPDSKENYEKIPLRDIDLVANLLKGDKNQYENINLFENYNETTRFLGIREVPIKKVELNDCDPCGCHDWDFEINLKCPSRSYSWYFLELRYGMAMYSDLRRTGTEIQRNEVLFEGALGIRFGNKRQWGLGVMASTGTPVFDAYQSQDFQRPIVALHGRWQSPSDNFLGICMKPFIYTDFGLPIDGLSLALPKLSLSTECKECRQYLEDLEASGQLPGIDFSWPLVYGFGFGFELPFIGTDFMSLSADIGFRSVGIGEETQAAGFDNVPSMRRINMLLMRIGLTF